MTATQCTAPRCRRLTKHPTGRCHHHPADRHPASKLALNANLPPVPTAEDAEVRSTRTSGGDVIEEWVQADGELSRSGLPAQISRDRKTGRITFEGYLLDGSFSRLDGPAIASYRSDGTALNRFFVAGVDCGREWGPDVPAAMKRIPSHRADREVRASSFAVLLDEGHTATEVLEVLGQGVRTPGGVREVLGGAPAEWVRSYEEGGAGATHPVG